MKPKRLLLVEDIRSGNMGVYNYTTKAKIPNGLNLINAQRTMFQHPYGKGMWLLFRDFDIVWSMRRFTERILG